MDYKLGNRIKNEILYHDLCFSDRDSFIRRKTKPFYAINFITIKAFQKILFSHIDENSAVKVLEYGCGDGGSAIGLAEKGVNVVGIDISSVAVEKSLNKASQLNLSNIKFYVMNAERLEFDDASFDVVCGSGILHHLDLKRSYKQIQRILKPGGVAIFIEPLGHNPFINLFRYLTPSYRTKDEHPLLLKDIYMGLGCFKNIDIFFFHFLSLFTIPFFKLSLFPNMLNIIFIF